MSNAKFSLKKLNHSLRFVWDLSPSYLLLYILKWLLKSLFPYVPIYCGALIIDKLIAQETASSIMVVVYWMVGIDLVVGVAIAFLENYLTAADTKIANLLGQKMSDKTAALSYNQLEDQNILHLLKAAEEGSNSSGGLGGLVENIGRMFYGLSNLIYSCILMRGLFSQFPHTPVDGWDNFLNNPYSALILFALLLLYIVMNAWLASIASKEAFRSESENVEGNRRFSYFYGLCTDYEEGKDIRLFHMQPFLVEAQLSDKYNVNATWEKFEKEAMVLNGIMSAWSILLAFAAYAFLGLKALYGYVSIGEAVSYAGAVTLLADGLSTILSSLIDAFLIANYFDNYFVYEKLPCNIDYGKEKLDETKPLTVEFRHVSFTYPRQKEKALDDVSLRIEPGEKLAIVGVNGAGKTTLMKLICRFYEPDSGEILVNDIPLSAYDEHSAYRLFSIVFQDFKLFSFRLRDNVSSGPNGDEEKIWECLRKAGLEERVKRFPEGLNTILYNKNEETGVEISGGEAQKIAIARALYKDSPFVILDEPTSALDPKSEAEIYEKLGILVEGKSAVFISHRMSSTQFCDEIAVIDQGKIVEYGNHKELMAKPDGLYKKMWDSQAQYYQ